MKSPEELAEQLSHGGFGFIARESLVNIVEMVQADCRMPNKAVPITMANDLAEFQKMQPETRRLINRLVKAMIDSGQPIEFEC